MMMMMMMMMMIMNVPGLNPVSTTEALDRKTGVNEQKTEIRIVRPRMSVSW